MESVAEKLNGYWDFLKQVFSIKVDQSTLREAGASDEKTYKGYVWEGPAGEMPAD